MFNKKEYYKEYYKTHKKQRIKNQLKYQKKHRTERTNYARKWLKTLKGKEYTRRCKNSFERKKYYRIWQQSPKGKEHSRRYYQSPRGRFVAKKNNLNHKLRTKDLTIQIIQRVYEDNIKQYGTLTCYLCLKPIPFGKDHLEHKQPVSRGGTNKRDNLDIACESCNCSKQNKTLEEFNNFRRIYADI